MTGSHTVDLDYTKIKFSDEQAALFDEYIVSTRIRAARNISGYRLPAGSDSADRAGVEQTLVEAFNNFDGDLAGKYYPLGGMDKAQEDFLQENGFLFQKPTGRNLLTAAGAAREWPNNRGIFHNNSKTVLCWVNEEDHCRIISMQNGKSILCNRCVLISGALPNRWQRRAGICTVLRVVNGPAAIC